MPSRIEVVPSAKRLTASLRDIGYDVPHAVADLIDNSLVARAKRVDVDLKFAGEASWVRISDNGSGIETGRLNEAMRYGTERDYGSGDLGRFGLGLKTASLSQCRVLTVATRTSKSRRQVEIRRWDMTEVERTNRWTLLRLSPSECPRTLLEPLDKGPGTVVMWEHLDRILNYKQPGSGHARRGFEATCREVEEHLAMVFHRFLSGEAQSRKVEIRINGNVVRPWDPFARNEARTRKLGQHVLDVEADKGVRSLHIQPYVLPSQAEFSTPAAFQIASGPRRWNRQQGFYIYREQRLIQSGGWNRLRTQDEHTKLARIAVDIPRDLDDVFGINVSKMVVTLPQGIRDDMGDIAAEVAAVAKEVYTGRQGSGATAGGSGARTRPGSRSRSQSVSLARVKRVLRRTLRGHPRLLRKVLDELNAEVSD